MIRTAIAQIPFVATFLIAVFIGVTTLTPPSEGGEPLPIPDKLAHLIAFLVLVLPLGLASISYMRWLAPVALFYGGAIELIQPSFGRSAEWADFAADAAGVILGLAICWLWARVRG